MPHFNFDELIGDNPVAPGDAEMTTEGPDMGSLFSSTHQSQLISSLPTRSLIPAHTPSVSGSNMASPHVIRPVTRRMQSTPRSSLQLKNSPSTKANKSMSIYQSPLRSLSNVTPAVFSFRESPIPTMVHKAPQTVIPSYTALPAVPLDASDYWRNDAGLFLGRSFRVCFSPSGELFTPAGVRNAGGHKVAVISLKDRLFAKRGYGDLLQTHKDMRACVDGMEGADTRDLMQVSINSHGTKFCSRISTECISFWRALNRGISRWENSAMDFVLMCRYWCCDFVPGRKDTECGRKASAWHLRVKAFQFLHCDMFLFAWIHRNGSLCFFVSVYESPSFNRVLSYTQAVARECDAKNVVMRMCVRSRACACVRAFSQTYRDGEF